MPMGTRAKDSFVIYFLISLLLFGTLIAGISAAAARNEAALTREVLCIGITSNASNDARFDPRVIAVCDGVVDEDAR